MSAGGSLIRRQRGLRLDHRRAGRQGIGRGILVSFVLIIALSFTMLAGLLTAMVTVFRCSRAFRLMPGVPVISSPGDGGL
jgi:hypothetical protein